MLCCKKPIPEKTKSENKDITPEPVQDAKLQWSNRVEYVISLIGYTFGLGDIWRFPYLTLRNGGGVFLIPFVIMLMLCGLPLYFIELSVAQFSGKGLYSVWDICPLFRSIAFGVTFVNYVVTVYYAVLRVWILEYLVSSFTSVLPWTTCGNEWNTNYCIVSTDTNSSYDLNSSSSKTREDLAGHTSTEEFWNNRILRASSGIWDLGTIQWQYALYLFILQTIVFFSMVKTVQSIGKLMYITTLGPIFLLLVVWIRALTLPGSAEGMLYFIKPDVSKLWGTQLWIEATLAAFYTLGPGWGGLITFGCHNKFTSNCYRYSICAVLLSTVATLLAGFAIFSVLGVMAKSTNLPFTEVVSSGFKLSFVVLPEAIVYFPLPQLWAILFFILLLLPGIDAQVVMLEPVINTLEEAFPHITCRGRRWPFLLFACILTFTLSLILATQGGVYIFQLLDWYTANWTIVFVAFLETVIFSWIYGGDQLDKDIQIMLGIRMPTFVRISCAYLTPVCLVVILVITIFTYTPPNYGDYEYPASAQALGWCFSMASVFIILAGMVVVLYNAKGSLEQRLKQAIRPTESWGPIETQPADNELMSEGKPLSLRRLVIYNLTGRKFQKDTHVLNQEENFHMLSSKVDRGI